jgi:predicted anti-sigma-YlaC factor YlaD
MTRLRRRAPQIACSQLVELVTDYLEAGLDAADRVAVEQHLKECGHCTAYVRQVTRLLELTAGPAEPVPDALLEDLTARFRRRR